tara:strand:+ start:175 stop:615 length:441 start_codon:yes stop_codon:yes gene_type:complete
MIITDEKILRKVSTEWSGKPEELEKLLEKMTKAMEERNGVGISAIQVGVPKRIFLAGNPVEVFINPRILSKSSYEKKDWEGCLSCGAAQVRVKRAHSISLEYMNYKDGKFNLIRRKFEKFDARVVQHELDHLNGILILDRGKVYKP